MLLEERLFITLLDVLRMIPVSWVDVIRKILLRLMFVYQSLPFSKSVKGKQDIMLLIFALLYNAPLPHTHTFQVAPTRPFSPN